MQKPNGNEEVVPVVELWKLEYLPRRLLIHLEIYGDPAVGSQVFRTILPTLGSL